MKKTTLPFFLLELKPFIIFDSDNPLISHIHIIFNVKIKKKLLIHSENMAIQIYLKFYHQKKNEMFQIKTSDIFHISTQNTDYGYSLEPPRRGGSNEYPQSMFLSRNKKNNVYPYKPQFYYIKVGFKEVKII